MDARPCRTSMRRSLFTAEYDTDRTSDVLGHILHLARVLRDTDKAGKCSFCAGGELRKHSGICHSSRPGVKNETAATTTTASSATEAARKNIFLKFMCAASFTLLYPHYNCICK